MLQAKLSVHKTDVEKVLRAFSIAGEKLLRPQANLTLILILTPSLEYN